MNRLQDIEHAIAELNEADLARFREWFAHFDAAQWDRQFEHDARSGRLDRMAEEALRDKREGRCRPL